MLRRITAFITVASLLFAFAAPLGAFAATQDSKGGRRQAAKLAPELGSAATSNETVRVIIQTKGASAALDAALAERGANKRRRFEALDAVVAEVPAGALAQLAERDDVSYVSPDREVRAQIDVTRETTGAALVQAG